MKIVVGSQNVTKVDAVREILQDYPHLKDAAVIGTEVDTTVSRQPLSLDEVTAGAMARAKNAFADCDYSIGLEAGFMQVPGAKSGHMNVCAAAIYDGTNMHLGISSGFETPNPELMRLVVEEHELFDIAAKRTGLTGDEHIGKHEGIIGLITNGRLDRKEYNKQALRTALIHIDQIT